MGCCGKRIASKAKRIAQGNLAVLLGKNKELAEVRKAVCADCKHCITDFPMHGIDLCGLCYCLLDAKTRVPKEACPLDKWTATS